MDTQEDIREVLLESPAGQLIVARMKFYGAHDGVVSATKLGEGVKIAEQKFESARITLEIIEEIQLESISKTNSGY